MKIQEETLTQVIIELPWPPSANSYYRHVMIPLRNGKVRSATLLSADGREWLKTVGRLLFSKNIQPVCGPISIEVFLHPPTRRSYDVDNRAKPLLDAMKRRKGESGQPAWLMEDDDQVHKLTLSKAAICAPDGKCVVIVTILPCEQKELEFEP